LIRAGSYEDWNDTQLEEQIRSSPKLFNGGIKQLITVAVITPEVKLKRGYDKARAPGQILPEAYGEYLSLIERYNQSWKEELGRFYEDGTPPGEVIFPTNISFNGGRLSNLDLNSRTQ
jgi:hypothetical protein